MREDEEYIERERWSFRKRFQSEYLSSNHQCTQRQNKTQRKLMHYLVCGSKIESTTLMVIIVIIIHVMLFSKLSSSFHFRSLICRKSFFLFITTFLLFLMFLCLNLNVSWLFRILVAIWPNFNNVCLRTDNNTWLKVCWSGIFNFKFYSSKSKLNRYACFLIQISVHLLIIFIKWSRN